MSDTPGRLLGLLSLLQTPREWPGSELATRLGVSLRSNADTLEWLAWHLLTLGYDMEVHEPPELIAHLRQIGSRATRAASPSAA
ncbi:WYL domain-containing protein [Micromonospora sp. MED01]|uniref:WYL domain-containing protein n=1 Tax=Micromonospora alfalfae TaxID=2911212 RepID=UPI001EE8B923|nr:WYL domain-containing protein [Micromonospora alfalfae]